MPHAEAPDAGVSTLRSCGARQWSTIASTPAILVAVVGIGASYQWHTTTSPVAMRSYSAVALSTGKFTQPWLP